jgi:hypothetical protein
MPRYHFHVDNGEFIPDPAGTELRDVDEARVQAVHAAGSMITDADHSFWKHQIPFVMHVTDANSILLFSLQFGAKVPAGSIRFIPESFDEPDE